VGVRRTAGHRGHLRRGERGDARLYGWDKYQAIRQAAGFPNEHCTPGAIGRMPGALAGRFLFRHKSEKGRYLLIFWIIVLTHALGWTLWWWMMDTAGGLS